MLSKLCVKSFSRKSNNFIFKPFKLTTMKINFLLIAILIVTISSCSTAYKTGQTPDDVYYSPAHFQDDKDSVRTDRDKYQHPDNTVYENSEDREIRRRVHNRRYRRYDDRYDYPYGSNYPYSNNPAYGKPQYGAPQNLPQPRKTNLGAYKPNTTTDSSRTYDPKFGTQNNGTTTAPVRSFGKPNNSTSNGSGVGNFIRKVFTSDNNFNNNYNRNNSNNTTPSTTFERSNSSNNNNSNSSTNSSTNKSSSTSAPVRTFKNDQ